MKTIVPKSIKLTVPFKAGELAQIPWEAPVFELALGGVKIQVKVSAKAARKLAVHQGSAVLQGQLASEAGRLVLRDAGFAFNDPRPAPLSDPVLTSPPSTGSRPIEQLAQLVGGLKGKP
jgi:hypothetical protein